MTELKLLVPLKSGKYIRTPAKIERRQNRIFFHESPFALKDEIKAMAGSKWHGFEDPPRKMWSIEDSPRNWFQLRYLMGENPYEWFDRPLVRHEYKRSLYEHQKDMADAGLTYHFQIWAAEMGVGKTLSAIEVIERSNHKLCFWVGPKSTLPAIQREFKKWKLDPTIKVELMTYEKLRSKIDLGLDEIPGVVIFDESIRLKTAASLRTRAAQSLADKVRETFGMDGFVILMSGTPAPKKPTDWWAQAEVCYPGFLREGDTRSMAMRMGFFEKKNFESGPVNQQVAWRDDERKCDVCGKFEEEHRDSAHRWKPSVNEVALLYERLKGLVVVKHKKDCLDLPDKIYRKIKLTPSESVKRLAQAVMDSADRAVTALCQLREISDGFLYRNEAVGTMGCLYCENGKVKEWYDPDDEEAVYKSIDMMRESVTDRLKERVVDCPKCKGTQTVPRIKKVAKYLPTPKEGALLDLLDEVEEQGRIVIYAGFTGSVDRVTEICLKNRWDVVRCDGRGFTVYRSTSDSGREVVTTPPLDYWSDMENSRVAFVAHPESGGEGLTLTEASMEVFWSNSFKPNFRTQAEDRIHRPGMDENRGATIVDLVHLDQDERALKIIRENRNLELMTMGELREVLG